MCLLTYIPEDTQPDIDALRRGAKLNSDGHGFAIVVPQFGTGSGRILVRKSMAVEGLLKEFAALREVYPNGPAIFHSRITTDGVTELFNCHPFMVGGDKRTIVGHNGILPSSVRPGKGDNRSDTRIFAEEVAGMFRLNTMLGRELAGEWMGDYNKMALLTVDPAYDAYGYIINEDKGVWHQGIWYSNSSFKGYRSYGTSSSNTVWYSTGSGYKEWTFCGVLHCKSKSATVSPYTLRCSTCGACSICEANPCECVLLESTKGKDITGTTVTTVAPIPSNVVTVRSGASTLDANATSVDEYLEALEAAQAASKGIEVGTFDYGKEVDPEDDPADQGGRSQLEQVLAIVDFLNQGGNLEELPLDQQQQVIESAYEMLDEQRRTQAMEALIEELDAAGWPPDEGYEGSESDAEPRSELVPAWVSEAIAKRQETAQETLA